MFSFPFFFFLKQSGSRVEQSVCPLLFHLNGSEIQFEAIYTSAVYWSASLKRRQAAVLLLQLPLWNILARTHLACYFPKSLLKVTRDSSPCKGARGAEIQKHFSRLVKKLPSGRRRRSRNERRNSEATFFEWKTSSFLQLCV